MKPLNAREMASFDINLLSHDINALSQEERTRFYRDAIRKAHAARSEAVREMFRIVAEGLARRPLLMRALIDSAAALVMVIALAATASEPLSPRLVSIGHISSGLPLVW